VRSILWSSLTLAVLATSALSAEAQSLGEKKKMKEQEAYLVEKHTQPMQEKCGKIEVAFDWKSYDLEWWDKLNSSLYGYCAAVVDQLYYLCEDADAKPEVQAKIKKVVCKSCKGDKGERAVSLKSGTLEWTSCPKNDQPGNDGDYIKAYLMKTL
jgi:hypothetical protein